MLFLHSQFQRALEPCLSRCRAADAQGYLRGTVMMPQLRRKLQLAFRRASTSTSIIGIFKSPNSPDEKEEREEERMREGEGGRWRGRDDNWKGGMEGGKGEG